MRRLLLAFALLATVLVAAPAAAEDEQSERVRTVHLITGDTVQVLTRADGTEEARIVSGPHADGPVMRWRTATATYVVPKLSEAVRSKLDLSLFDVSQLGGGPVPVVVTRRDGTHRDSYSSTFQGIDAAELRGVRSIRLAGTVQPAPPEGETHTLTVQVRDGSGDPVPHAVVLIMNLDDSSRYLETPYTGSFGTVTAEVPEGNYGVLVWTFEQVLTPPEIAVTDDSTVPVNLADATVRPHVSLPGFRRKEAILSVGRMPEAGFAFPIEFSGPRFFMRVQPASGEVPHGSLTTGVAAKLVKDGTLAVTADVAEGVPDDLTYVHDRGDFARVVQTFYGNGPAGLRQTYVEASAPDAEFFTGRSYLTRMPGQRTLLLQASRKTYYQQTAMPQTGRNSENITQLITVDRFPDAERTYRTTFAHGPVGPGGWGSVTRAGNRLRGFFSLFSSAGSEMFSFIAPEDGDWTLRQGDRVLDRGRSQVHFDVAVPPGWRSYELTATSHPTAENWDLSTNVEDVWTFHSARGERKPAVLMPSYVPPMSLAGFVDTGPTRFRLSLDRRVARAGLELSTDGGATWRDARVVRVASDAFRVGYRNPAAQVPGQKMSIRVTARDRDGNSVRETAIDVYRLRR